MRAWLLMASILPVLFAQSPAVAGTRDAFAARIAQAFQAADKTAALKGLFYLEGVDAESLTLYEQRIIGRMLAKYDAPTIGFEDLPSDFDPTYVSNGYEYQPNVAPLGYVVLDGNTRLVFGQRAGRHYFAGVSRRAVNLGGPPDRLVQMMAIGQAHPPVRFEGFCDVMQSNGQLKRMTLADEGRGNTTVAMMAQHIAACEVTMLSRDGTLSLTLREGESDIFTQRIAPSDVKIVYRR